MNKKQKFYPESQFGGFTDIDGTIAFYTRINALIRSNYALLDVGCGRGAYTEDELPMRRELRVFRGKVDKVIGLDVDEFAKNNPNIDEFHLHEGNSWPITDNSVDLCLCDNVLEHIEEPDLFFSECRRVLKDGGYLCIRTPNLWSYVGIVSKLIPNRLHSKILSKVQENRAEQDVFPTYHRCNTIGKLRRTLLRHGFKGVAYGYEAEPSYLSFSRIAYYLGVLHQRFAPRLIKPAIFAFAKIHKSEK